MLVANEAIWKRQRLCQIVALLVVVVVLSPVWLFLAQYGEYGLLHNLVAKHGYRNWTGVARHILTALRSQSDIAGRSIETLSEAQRAGIFNIDHASQIAPIYSASQWRLARATEPGVTPGSTTFAYDIPRLAPQATLYLSERYGCYYVLSGRREPIWWWDVVARRILADFLGPRWE